ncbi:MAG TPA: hypothetical protein VF574_10290 [Allosphingosinicella sp.]|jgi:hypothetical protein
MTRIVQTLALALVSAAAAAASAEPQPASPAQSWRIYGGDYETLSALDTLSVRRDGRMAYANELTFSRKGPLSVGERKFDYVVVEVAHDCDAHTYWGVRAHFFDRHGKALWSHEVGNPPKSSRNSSPTSHYWPYLCGESVGKADPRGLPSVEAFLAGWAKWMREGEAAP